MIFQPLSVTDNVYTEASDNGFSNALLTSVYFRAETDRHDTPVSCKKSYVFRHSLDKTEGHVFFLSFPVSGKSIVYIVPTPDHVTPALSIHKGELRIECGGYPIVRGECLIGEEKVSDEQMEYLKQMTAGAIEIALESIHRKLKNDVD